jgi:hypothetical protein
VPDIDYNEKWVPFAYCESNHYYCIDVSSMSNQLIEIDYDSGEINILSDDLALWFLNYVEKLLSNQLVYSDEHGFIVDAKEVK